MISVINAAFFRPSAPKSRVSMFFRQDGYSVGEVGLDLILNEEHSQEAVVTDHPVQDGSVVNDHIALQLRMGTLTALVSNWSVNHQSTAIPADATLEEIRSMSESVEPTNRAAEAWEALKALQTSKTLVTIVTALEVYENVAITRVGTSRDGDTGEALAIELEFKQVKTVKLVETEVTLEVQPTDMDSGINRQSSMDIAKGQQVGVEATPAEQQQMGGQP